MTQARVVREADGAMHGPWLFKAAGRDTAGRFDFMVGTVDYLSGPPLHLHLEQDDSFYVLEGVLTVQANSEIIELRQGDFISIPPGVPHTFDNLDKNQRVRAINLITPGGFDDVLDAAARLFPKATPAQLQELRDRYGVEIVGPRLREHLGIEQ
jgi:quercetin dioxygenase-like cupin family protein